MGEVIMSRRNSKTHQPYVDLKDDTYPDPEQRLITAIILQAVRDLTHKQRRIRDDAKYFFSSSYGKLLLSLSDVDSEIMVIKLQERGLL